MWESPGVRRWGVGLVTAGGVSTVVAMFGPWVRSGSNYRSSFELVNLIDRLGFAANGPVAAALRSWPCAPLAVIVTIVLANWIGGRVIGLLALVVGLTIGAVGLAVRRVPESTLIGSGWGSSLAGIGGLVMVMGAITMIASVAPDSARVQDVP
jgi:hypothetical protein